MLNGDGRLTKVFWAGIVVKWGKHGPDIDVFEFITWRQAVFR